ncbi:hypothetical protein [Xanthomonas melonis]|uniref:Secreted protein n=1 Tax=Xanthomonas melonis TaxID=56456 RepID=A0A2S7DLZ2_9XANT|nr:hypothetical protein [Xanthomonas melonis]MCC4598928.1 hypothetical protein [Xanthomonas melonis]PPU74830.1 hypothetical protein XmelCFBP4644_02685 [Xanthomonas melonis]
MMRFRKPGWMLPGMLCVACLPIAAGAQDHSADSKVGLDHATGKPHAPTDADSAAPDRSARLAAGDSSARTTVPQTAAAAQASVRELPSDVVARQLPPAPLSSLIATRQADGSFVIEHDDHFDTQPTHAEQGALPHE